MDRRDAVTSGSWCDISPCLSWYVNVATSLFKFTDIKNRMKNLFSRNKPKKMYIHKTQHIILGNS